METQYERNFIDNVNDVIENVTKLEGVVSRKTQLNMLPNDIVPDSDDEQEQINRELLEKEELPMVTE